MRRLSAPALLLFLCACGSGDRTIRFDETATMLHIADPRAGKQLTRGFFNIEGAGRWTGRAFSATLKPPPAAARKGAILVLQFGIPGTSIDVLHSIQVSAVVNGVALTAQEYAKAGDQQYVREVPAAAFRGSNATVDFTLDKVLPPAAGEQRELGIIVNTVGFEAK